MTRYNSAVWICPQSGRRSAGPAPPFFLVAAWPSQWATVNPDSSANTLEEIPEGKLRELMICQCLVSVRKVQANTLLLTLCLVIVSASPRLEAITQDPYGK